MTLKECANAINLSESYLSKNFPIIQKKYEEKGIKIIKKGRGKAATYGILKKGDSYATY